MQKGGVPDSIENPLSARGKDRLSKLSVWVYIVFEESQRKNYEEKVYKVEEILSNWGDKRFISLAWVEKNT